MADFVVLSDSGRTSILDVSWFDSCIRQTNTLNEYVLGSHFSSNLY